MTSRARSFAVLNRFVNIPVKVDKDGRKAIVQFPGVALEDVNRVGRISINRILHWFTSTRVYAYHCPNEVTGTCFLEYDRMTDNYFTFMASSKSSVERAFYSHINSGNRFPATDIEIHLGYVGRSSLNSVSTLYGRENGELLAKNVNQVVLIDRTTRTPTPLPDWWREKYESLVVENERLIVVQRDVPQSGIHRYEMMVTWSDTDAYKHTNYLSYVRFCLDAACDAIDKGHYKVFGKDILEYDVKDVESLYAGESLVNEKIIVDTWQDASDAYALYFSIANSKGKVVFQSCIKFYEPRVDL